MRRVSVQWDGANFLKAAEDSGQKALFAGAVMAADFAVRSFGRQHGGVPSLPGMPPNTQSGQLRNSIAAVGMGAVGRLRAAYGTNLRYARILEVGGLIRPTRAKMLAVPLTKKAAMESRRVTSIRQIPGLVHIRTKRNVQLLVKKIPGKRARWEPWFRLQAASLIAPRPYLSPVYRRHKATIDERLRKTFESDLRLRYKGITATIAPEKGGGNGK